MPDFRTPTRKFIIFFLTHVIPFDDQHAFLNSSPCRVSKSVNQAQKSSPAYTQTQCFFAHACWHRHITILSYACWHRHVTALLYACRRRHVTALLYACRHRHITILSYACRRRPTYAYQLIPLPCIAPQHFHPAYNITYN